MTFTGPPRAIWFLNKGTTLPRLPNTLPKRTTLKNRPELSAASKTIVSAMRLVAPITLTGRMALSVEIITRRSTPYSRAASTTLRVPWMLLVTASSTFISIKGTCLWAAA